MAVASKIEKLQDSVIHTNIMIYGDSGVGKTVWCGSGQRVLFIAPEDSGTLSAKRHGSTASKWPVKTWNDLLEAYEYVYEQLEAGTFEFDVLAIDSLTEMQYMSMQHVLRLAVGEDAKDCRTQTACAEGEAEEDAGDHADAARDQLLREDDDGGESRGEDQPDQHGQHARPEEVRIG